MSVNYGKEKIILTQYKNIKTFTIQYGICRMIHFIPKNLLKFKSLKKYQKLTKQKKYQQRIKVLQSIT
jgi:hypothetical protein